MAMVIRRIKLREACRLLVKTLPLPFGQQQRPVRSHVDEELRVIYRVGNFLGIKNTGEVPTNFGGNWRQMSGSISYKKSFNPLQNH